MNFAPRFPAAYAILLLCSLLLDPIAVASAGAQWLPGGIQVPGGHGDIPVICRDSDGGLLVAWRRTFGVQTFPENIVVQRLLASGSVAPGWPDSALRASSAVTYQAPTSIVADALGGGYVVWADARPPNIFAQHFLSTGSVSPDWPSDGLPLSSGKAIDPHHAVPDGAGGLFVVWEDQRVERDIYAQRILPNGLPAPGWTAGGLAVATEPGVQTLPQLASDGHDGIFIGWINDTPGSLTARATHLLSDGSVAPGWPAGGLVVSEGKVFSSMAGDGTGGLFVLTADQSTVYLSFDTNYYLFHVSADGGVAPGWPAAGVVVCNAPGFRSDIKIISDGSGGAIAVWADDRSYTQQYALRIAPDGSRWPGWAENGNRVSTVAGYQSASVYGGSVVGDDLGGAYITFQQDALNTTTFIQHLAPNGSPASGWTTDGMPLGDRTAQMHARLASDGANGVYAAWENYWTASIYAQHYLMDGVVATELSLVSAAPSVDGVTLLWQGDVAPMVTASVERRTTATGWQVIGAPRLEGRDRLSYLDADVSPGSRYGYRLSYVRSGVTQQSQETWVDVPRSAKFALEGARPNPAIGHITAAFSLLGDAQATLSLVDVTGREIARREVGSMGAGRHVALIENAAQTPPGVYWLRLTEGGRTQLARVAVIR